MLRGLITALFCLAGTAGVRAQVLPAEVVVHVYRDKQDDRPFIEFVATVREEDGRRIVDLSEVEGRDASGSFMIISGVQRAGETGVKASDKYEISFAQVGDYRIYEQAVMEYLRRLPLPEPEVRPEPEIRDFTVPTQVDAPEGTGALAEPPEDPEEPWDDEPAPAPLPAPVPDSGSVLVHVHRNAEDIEPYREYVLRSVNTTDGTRLELTEVRGMQPRGGFLIMNGFQTAEGVQKSEDYEVIAYNLDAYSDYEAAVLDHLLRMTVEDFQKPATVDVAAPTAPAEVPAAATAPVAQKPAPSARDLRQQSKQLEKAKFKAPKYKNKYGKRQAQKMSSRSAGKKSGKKTKCPSLRGY